MSQQLALILSKDHADAIAYWRDKEWKKFAVDVVAGPRSRPTYRNTFYACARTGERAIACVKREAIGLPKRAQFVARLAGPSELGCVPAPASRQASDTQRSAA